MFIVIDFFVLHYISRQEFYASQKSKPSPPNAQKRNIYFISNVLRGVA